MFLSLIIVAFFVISVIDKANCASCCDNAQKKVANRQDWLDNVNDLDELHKFYLKSKLLDSLNVKEAPLENATRWKRAKKLFNSGENQETDNEEELVRKYTLRVKGTLIGKIKRHHQHNHHQNRNDINQNDNTQDGRNSENCVAHYDFNAILPRGINQKNNNNRKTHLQTVNIRLARDAKIHLHIAKITSTTTVNPTDVQQEEDVIEILTVGEDENSNDDLLLVDLTSVLFPYWSVENGVVFSLKIKSRSLCALLNEDNAESEYEYSLTSANPILNMDLKETESTRAKRTASSRNHNRNSRHTIVDCQTLWDQAFMQNTTDSLYDALMPCCRRKVSVDFEQLGWSQWVIAPLKFDSYYCLGRCTHFGGFAVENTEGPAFYSELMNQQRRAKSNGLSACCSPVKFSPMTITVMIGENEQMTQTLEDVVVNQCGCM